MNAAHKLLLAGAEAAERAAGPERGAQVYRAVSEQTSGEGRDAALLGFLRCAAESSNSALIDQAITAWGTAASDAFDGVHAIALRLAKAGRKGDVMELLRKDVWRSKRPRSLFALALALAEIERNFEASSRTFREAQALARQESLAEAAHVRALHVEVRVPRLRKRALLDCKHLGERAGHPVLPSLHQRLLAEVDLYAESRFRRAAAMQQLAELASTKDIEGDEAERVLVSYIEGRRDTLSPLELDRANAFLATRKIYREVSPGAALTTRATAVLGGARPSALPQGAPIHALLLEFVAECAEPEECATPHAQALLARLHANDPVSGDYLFRCLRHVWKKPGTARSALERSVRVAKAALERPAPPSGGYLSLLPDAPEPLALDLAFAAAAAGEKGAENALLRAAMTLGQKEPPERTYVLLRELRGFLPAPRQTT